MGQEAADWRLGQLGIADRVPEPAEPQSDEGAAVLASLVISDAVYELVTELYAAMTHFSDLADTVTVPVSEPETLELANRGNLIFHIAKRLHEQLRVELHTAQGKAG